MKMFYNWVVILCLGFYASYVHGNKSTNIFTDNENGKREQVINGRITNIRKYPHHVQLPACGGSLISDRHILTAAHCSSVRKKVLAGATNSYVGESHEVLYVDRHPKFYTNNEYLSPAHDIAVWTLAKPIKFSQVLQPIMLPRKDIKGGEMARIAGWGSPNNLARDSRLKEAELKVLTHEECYSAWGKSEYEPRQDNKINSICAIDEHKRTSPCFGDSGGGLVSGNTLIGIINSAFLGCPTNRPARFLSVYHHLDFILKTVQKRKNSTNEKF